MVPNNIIEDYPGPKAELEAAMRRLGPDMARLAAETAGGFLAVDAKPSTDRTSIPRLPDSGMLRCSQWNLGEKRAMVFNMSVDRSEWKRLFPAGADEGFRMDAFCEMANCICGTLVADAGFVGEFGCLHPDVPQAFPSRAPLESRSCHGAFSLDGVWVRFSIDVHQTAGIRVHSALLAA